MLWVYGGQNLHINTLASSTSPWGFCSLGAEEVIASFVSIKSETAWEKEKKIIR